MLTLHKSGFVGSEIYIEISGYPHQDSLTGYLLLFITLSEIGMEGSTGHVAFEIHSLLRAIESGVLIC